MKLYSLLLCLFVVSCAAPKRPEITFSKQDVYFSIDKGQSFSTDFKFKNTGSDSLRIISANASCGCTGVTFPLQAILPGQEGNVHVIFDSREVDDSVIVKAILIESNTKPILHTLTLKGSIRNTTGTRSDTLVKN